MSLLGSAGQHMPARSHRPGVMAPVSRDRPRSTNGHVSPTPEGTQEDNYQGTQLLLLRCAPVL